MRRVPVNFRDWTCLVTLHVGVLNQPSFFEPHSIQASNLPSTKLPVTMSFAGRRRGNKVKKGVQFTVMVVGTFFPPLHPVIYKLGFLFFFFSSFFISRFLLLKVLPELDVRPLSIPFASLKFWLTKFLTTLTRHTSRRALELNRSMSVSPYL